MRLLIIAQKVDEDDDNLGFFCGWVREFSKHFSDVVVIASFVGRHSFPANVEVRSMGKEQGVRRFGRLYRFWEHFSIEYASSDAVFFHMIPEFVLLASPFLLSLRRTSALWYVHKQSDWRLRFAEKLVDFIFTASQMSFRLLSKRVIYTGHAIDTEIFKPNVGRDSNPEYRIISVGRIAPVKDCETIVLACRELKRKWRRSWVLLFYGSPVLDRDHGYLVRLKKAVEENGLLENVRFEGSRPFAKISEVYRENDLFVSMSTTGSIDKSVLEAMASGIPVLTSNEAFKSVLPESLFVERRTPGFLAERIMALAESRASDFDLRRVVVEKHSLEHTIGKIARHLTDWGVNKF